MRTEIAIWRPDAADNLTRWDLQICGAEIGIYSWVVCVRLWWHEDVCDLVAGVIHVSTVVTNLQKICWAEGF